ncbi:hypothetical protein ECG_00100 [Echinococcus granulosus]|nr:hypothetical protein ECG_00100 [Echinococcus granulosus]
MALDPTYDVPFGCVQVKGCLGEGDFGLVLCGSAVHLPGGIIGRLPVAIKTLRNRFGLSSRGYPRFTSKHLCRIKAKGQNPNYYYPNCPCLLACSLWMILMLYGNLRGPAPQYKVRSWNCQHLRLV